ncbi:uncharacterized protein ASPGLDRAFT_168477 [Aspergillus glaucus CBS 516.65]|uniref:Suppressor of anucleate metulae protein B n=1 Tax=Aspergillus glaucus CBS 516.65 TaxID=1160497 RepID=A0A1L9VN96_ASPGL|nr:hypothetical protein ASPGLDRAFT_168477 [Aspergillus glaucus CBS 516.65]OJJ85389.1 hypothetical protein ASPGLDRAFT_168477 [Aspergillus glaucus CBS 516.65]
MDHLRKGTETAHEVRAARIVWAAHILSYLTNNRSHAELHQLDADPGEFEDCASDYKTENNVVLTGPEEFVRQKFLNCIAQLLSPSKGWDFVTAVAVRESENFVEVDVARNDSFLSEDNDHGYETRDYCSKLEEYLRTNAEDIDSPPALASEFELKSIRFTHRRVDHWISKLRTTWKTNQNYNNQDEQQWPGLEKAARTWTNMVELISRPDNAQVDKVRDLMVQQAYMCIISMQVRQLLYNVFGSNVCSKLWTTLNFLARPLLDCRLLRSIATREPQFRCIRISLIPPKPKTCVTEKYRLDIFQAWAQLGLDSPSHSEIKMLNSHKEEFRKSCAKSFCLHAEMQLFSHYEDGVALPPTLDYFGCSKKTCFLCENILKSLPKPIATRGRHGICYPAWGLPCSTSAAMEIATNALERDLLFRIRLGFNKLSHQRRFTAHVPQSSVVSNFSKLTLEDWQGKERKLELSRKEEAERRRELLITCYYCSLECQRSDFPSHKLLCKHFSTQPVRPSTEHKRAIFFPVDRSKPRMIWVPCRREIDEDGVSWTKVDAYPYLGTDNPIKGTLRIEHSPVRNRNLGSGFAKWAPFNQGYCISLIHRDGYLIDGSASNKSISVSVGASGPIPHEYRGPIIAVRGLPHESYDDIALADFRHLIDYLVSYRSTQIRESLQCPNIRAPTAIRGVKICCYGEIKLHGTEAFVSVEVDRATRIGLGDGAISLISSRLGMPLVLWKYPDPEFLLDPPGWPEGEMTADSNQNVAFLMMGTNPSKPGWGWAPPYWNREIGNVLVLREDGKDLNLDDVSMMCHFSRYNLQRRFEDTMVSDPNSEGRLGILDFITWENMVKHWEKNSGNGM